MNLLKNSPARVYAVAVAIFQLLTYYLPDLPGPLYLTIISAILMGGEKVQRLEDGKTAEAAEAVPATADTTEPADFTEIDLT